MDAHDLVGRLDQRRGGLAPPITGIFGLEKATCQKDGEQGGAQTSAYIVARDTLPAKDTLARHTALLLSAPCAATNASGIGFPVLSVGIRPTRRYAPPLPRR
ncbi:MAG: hypothetical protein Kow0032_28120 [Methyloligellaceae bacterium]